VFLKKTEDNKDITIAIYRDQVLEPIVFLLFDQLEPEYIFIKDGAKVHLKYTKLARLQHSIQGFDWPPSSPDLKIIEKV